MQDDLKKYILDLLKDIENGKTPKIVIVCPKYGVTIPFYEGENIGSGVKSISYWHTAGETQELTVEKVYG